MSDSFKQGSQTQPPFPTLKPGQIFPAMHNRSLPHFNSGLHHAPHNQVDFSSTVGESRLFQRSRAVGGERAITPSARDSPSLASSNSMHSSS
eukprot:2079628-Amphidinium_carterae.1